MRWPWRRSSKPNTSDAVLPVAVRRNRHTQTVDVHDPDSADPVLVFAQAYLRANGARIRHQDDLLVATMPDGTTTRYTTVAAERHADALALVSGGTVLAGMVAEVAEKARLSVLSLAGEGEPEVLARQALVAPTKGCGRCVSAARAVRVELCDACPIRVDGGRFVLAGMTKPPRIQTMREWTAWSVELTFRVSGRDRSGRTEESVRLALDAQTGRRVEVLTLRQAHRAGAAVPPEGATAMVEETLQRAHALLQPALDAAGAFVRQRAAQPYRERVREVMATYERLRREQPGEERAVAQSLVRELAAQAAIHAVEVRAELESICFVASPWAEALLTFHGGAQTTVALDLGRGIVEGRCSSCGAITSRGALCANGHLSCIVCLPGCATCAGDSDSHRMASSGEAKPGAIAEGVTGERIAALAACLPRLWAQCVRWLLGTSGFVLDAGGATDDWWLWHGTQGDQRVAVVPVNVPLGLELGPADVRQAAARVSAGPGAPRMVLVTSAQSLPEARALASEMGVVLWDRDEMAAIFGRVARRDAQVTRQARGEVKQRAAAAAKVRAHLLAVLDRAASTLTNTANAERAIGQAALTGALAELTAARQAAEQAFLAWETLVADWQAVFGEEPNAEGALVILANVQKLRSLRERATHLGKVTQGVFARLCRTPAEGEMGYGAWRSALIAEYGARCRALGARVALCDPAAWEDVERARDPEAAFGAEHAAQEARHAAGRAAQAYAHVARLAGKA